MVENTHIKDFETHRAVLTIDFGLPFVSLTCVDKDGEEIGTVSFSEWQVADSLGFEPCPYTTDLNMIIEKLEHHIFG